MTLDELFELFIRERKFLKNSSPKTIDFYRQSYHRLKKFGNPNLTRLHLQQWVISMREEGLKPVTVNVYVRGINSFTGWLRESGYISENLHMKPLKEEQKVISVFKEEHLVALLNHRPKTFTGHRLHALVSFLVDTGARVNEAFLLEREDLLLDDLLVRLKGKGSKQRLVPISEELRKVLWRFLKLHNSNYVFPTMQGGKLHYHDTLRDFKQLCDKLGIKGVRTSFHGFRHFYALNHLREGGNVFALQRLLGHSSVVVTQRYVNLETSDLQTVHKKTSILNRLK